MSQSWKAIETHNSEYLGITDEHLGGLDLVFWEKLIPNLQISLYNMTAIHKIEWLIL